MNFDSPLTSIRNLCFNIGVRLRSKYRALTVIVRVTSAIFASLIFLVFIEKVDEKIVFLSAAFLVPICMWALFLGAFVDCATDNYTGPEGPDRITIDDEASPLVTLAALLVMSLLSTGFGLYIILSDLFEVDLANIFGVR